MKEKAFRDGVPLALLLFSVGCGSSRGHAAASAPPAAVASVSEISRARPALRRGMNLGNALDAPNEGAWGVVLRATDFVSIKQAGFDHVRLPVRFSAHAAPGVPYAVDDAFFSRVDWAIDQALANGLAIVVDFHHYEEMMSAPDEHRARFIAIWKQIAERYRNRPASVAFELLNEPSDRLIADKWNGILSEALHVVRASNRSRTIVVEGVSWASAQSLGHSLNVPPDDPNLVGSFHMYQPMLFTHQGAPWMPREYRTQGIVFPGPPAQPIAPDPAASAPDWVRDWFTHYNDLPADKNPSGPATLAEELDLAQAFADRTHLPVYMGEFGCIDKADAKSRELWVRTTRKEAERHGFGWAYWDDAGSFQAYDRSNRQWLPYLKSALLE
jgi:endoglucanase